MSLLSHNPLSNTVMLFISKYHAHCHPRVHLLESKGVIFKGSS